VCGVAGTRRVSLLHRDLSEGVTGIDSDDDDDEVISAYTTHTEAGHFVCDVCRR